MYWKLLLLLGAFTEFSVSLNPTPLPELIVPSEDLRHCYENIADPKNNDTEHVCDNFADFRIQIHNYTTAFAEAHKDTDKLEQVPNEENIGLLEYAVNSAEYKSVVENIKCMNLTLAHINCSKYFEITNSTELQSLVKPELQRLLFSKLEYKTASCGRANQTKACVMELAFTACNDIVKQWASDLFDYSIEKCTNKTTLRPNSATGKYPLPLLMAFLVMTAALVFAFSPASD